MPSADQDGNEKLVMRIVADIVIVLWDVNMLDKKLKSTNDFQPTLFANSMQRITTKNFHNFGLDNTREKTGTKLPNSTEF
jgi:hypothetical protein